MYHISAAVGGSCVQGTVFCDDVGSHLVPIWSAAGSPTAGDREQGYGERFFGLVINVRKGASGRIPPWLHKRSSRTDILWKSPCVTLGEHKEIHSSPRMLVEGGNWRNSKSTGSKNSSGCTRARTYCACAMCRAAWDMVWNIPENSEENHKTKTYRKEINLRSICINDSSPPSTRLLGLESMTLLESRRETQKKSVPVTPLWAMLKFNLNLSSNIFDRSESFVLKNTHFVWSFEKGPVGLNWQMWLYVWCDTGTKE